MRRVRSRDLETGSLPERVLRRGSVQRVHIADRAVGPAQLAPGAVTTGRIGPQSIREKHLHPELLPWRTTGGLSSDLSSGTNRIANAATSKVVNHDLASTPRTVLVTPRAAESLWVSARTASNFTVTRAGTTGALDFDWLATGAEAALPEFQIPETDLALWLKGSSLVASTADGALVQTWEDVSGNGRNAVQLTEANRPTFETNIVNGHPVVRFDGTSDGLAGPGWTFTDEMVFVVMTARTSVSAGAGFLCRGPAGGQDYNSRNGLAIESNGGSDWRTVYGFQAFGDPGVAPVALAATGTWAVYEHTLNGSTLRVARNRSAAATTDTFTAGTSSPDGYVVGKRYSGGGFVPIDVAEVIAYSSYDATTRTTVLDYLADKYGITLT